jgi:hypothetical protein
MSIKEMEKDGILIGIVALAVVLGMVGSVSACIEIRDLGIDAKDEETIGFVDFKNEIDDIFLEEDENYTVNGLLTVYNDGMLIHEENITLEVVSFHGFAVNRPDMREFGIDMTEGTHTLSALIESGGRIVEAIYVYDGEVEEEEEEEEEKEKEEVDWLPCP